MRLPSAASVLGIDVGYSVNRKSSAVCKLSWRDGALEWSIKRFRHIECEWREAVNRAASPGPLLSVALDGPLRSGLDQIGCYRQAEAMLTRGLGRKIGKPGQSSSPVGRKLNAAANVYAQCVLDSATIAPARHAQAIHDRSIAEAFPSSFLGVMLPSPNVVDAVRGNRSDRFYVHFASSGCLQSLIEHFLPAHRTELAWECVADGTLRAVSVGYRVHRYDQRPDAATGETVHHAVDWEPFEISIVPVPVDPAAAVRGADDQAQPVPAIEPALSSPEEILMPETIAVEPAAAPAAPPPQVPPTPIPEIVSATPAHDAAADAIRAERERIAGLAPVASAARALVAATTVDTLHQRAIAEGWAPEALRSALWETVVQTAKPPAMPT
jgi:hypothetical protein